ncbi:MAG TPA: NADP-dependent oxidoreductase [Syntrophobacteria bacterium]|nr:NADP-dependent oxidoreductase [Syntrophobacteria bacterium]
MSQILSREIRLKHRPLGMPKEEHFEFVTVPVPEPGDGEMLVRNLYMSVDPYMRGRMSERESYVPPFQLGRTLEGGCVGRVVRSAGGRFSEGEFVLSMLGWREYFVSDGTGLIRIDRTIAPVQAYLGALGMPGLTAYVGLLDLGQPEEGDTVFVSAASGAVGAVVCQIARLKGCRVVGSAGSDGKIAWLRERAGVDAAFNYKKADDLSAEVAKHCPEGIDIYFDNVGGTHLAAALDHMKTLGRIVLCGMISQYNMTRPPRAPSNLILAITKRLTLRGFIVTDNLHRQQEFVTQMSRWIAEGRITWTETIVDGIENAPRAFLGLFTGENVGKMLVKIGPESEA